MLVKGSVEGQFVRWAQRPHLIKHTDPLSRPSFWFRGPSMLIRIVRESQDELCAAACD
jgi:hypothetical protein